MHGCATDAKGERRVRLNYFLEETRFFVRSNVISRRGPTLFGVLLLKGGMVDWLGARTWSAYKLAAVPERTVVNLFRPRTA